MADPQQSVASSAFSGYPDPPFDWEAERILMVSVKQPLYRLNRADKPSALYFDRSGLGRFDGPDQGYGILYVAQDIHTCFAETYARDYSRNRTAQDRVQNAVAEVALKGRKLFEIRSTRVLNLVDLTGKGLVRIGADSILTTGNYPASRRWSHRLWQYSQQFDGIRYRSRVDNDRYCYGLFDRVSADLQERDLGNLVDQHPHELARIFEDYCYALLGV
jgi:hypothetical protein